jgi:glycosyltransferase involved in cell wall biosynthesis
VNRFSAVHQFHSGTATGDAITNQMLHLQAELHGLGLQSEIFAEHVAVGLQDRIRSIRGYNGSASELLLQHHSIGYELFDDIIAFPNPIAAIYHNVTPERFFESPVIRELIRLGREQLVALSKRALFGIADSNFNRREMLAVGFQRVEVLPVRIDFQDFAVATSGLKQDTADWLYVGRIVGNKCQHDLVAAFAIYASHFNSNARLVLIGDTSDHDYVVRVKAEAERLGVADRVVMLGKVSDGQLRSAFAGAGVFVSVSEHEGFGVPILEAMAAGVPVVAYGSTAVPETMGGAGVLMRSKDPAVIAATVEAVQSDHELRARIIERQKTRVEQVQGFDTRGLLKRVLRRANGEVLPLEIQVQGPFETSYSLATMNRRLALGLDKPPVQAASIYATEGPGDYQPAPEDLERHPEATRLFRRANDVPYPDIVIRQMWPPRVIDTPGGITCEYFGWEESRIPSPMVEDFNRYLDGVGVMSNFVRDVLRESGVNIPICVVGNGVDPHDFDASIQAPELDDLRAFSFLHVSSAFPRKGVDILLDAYFSTFDGSSDVSLILKTFPNPHNEVGELLQSLRSQHPNPPDVRWINRDIDEHELKGLFNLAGCYVHPARGEGFGLPIAEAMAAGVPVIAPSYSGMADLVTDETAITIPYTVEEAQSHFDIPGSVWAEPDTKQLGFEMKHLVENPGSSELSARIARARDLVAVEFSWERAVHRWESFISDLELNAAPIKVAMVTTWNSRCGVAENSRYIVDHAADQVDFEIFADAGVQIIEPEAEHGVIRTWRNRWDPDLSELQDELRFSDADVLHVQFNFGFFEFQQIAQLIDRELSRRAVVITFHRTRDYDDRGEILTLRDIQPTLARVDRLIVHQEKDARFLAEMGLSENVTVIPVGASPPPPVSPDEARRALQLGNRPVIGTFGFLLPHKGTLELVRAVDSLRPEFPDILLLALCAAYPGSDSSDYEKVVRDEISSRGMQDNVVLVTEYLSDDAARTLLRAADAVVLPYRETGESSSAALRFILPLGRPVLVTDEPIFADSKDDLFVVDPSVPSGLEDGIRRVLMDKDLQHKLAFGAEDAARRFRWPRVIADHREVYVAAKRAFRERQHRFATPQPAGSRTAPGEPQ